MCCIIEIIIIFIITYIIIDIYNCHIKANKDKEDLKKKEEFQQLRKELIDYIYNNFYNKYNIKNEKINELLKINSSLIRQKLLRKIKKELIQKIQKDYFDELIKTPTEHKKYITAEIIENSLHNYEKQVNYEIQQIEFNPEIFK